MKKVYQTIVHQEYGDCMRAAIASLLEKDISEVPNFIAFPMPNYELMKYLRENKHGFAIWTCKHFTSEGFNRINSIELTKKVLSVDGGVKGYFYASVQSQTFGGTNTHAVIIDSDMNIVHDPNPSEKCLSLTADDIIDILVVSDDWYFKQDGNISKIKCDYPENN